MRHVPRDATAVSLLALVVLSAVSGGALAATSGDGGVPLQTDEFESNDDFDSATPITPPFDSEDLVVSTGDADFFAVELRPGDRFDVSASADREADVDLLVFDPNRDRIASSVSPDGGESVSLRAGQDGTYYVQVVGWADAEATYSLSITRTAAEPPENDEFEYNDGFSSSAAISTPFEESALLLADGDVDSFAVDLPADRRLHVEATFVHDEADLDLRVYDSGRNLVATGTSGTDNETISVPIVERGRHVIEVISPEGGATEYALAVWVGSAELEGTTDAPAVSDEAGEGTATSAGPSTRAEGPLTEDATDVTVPGFGVGPALAALLLFVLVLVTRLGQRRRGS